MSTADRSDHIDALALRLRPHYSRFLAPVEAAGEVLMTGHSHQAWPNVSREAHLEAWDDAALLADKKWDRIFGEILPAFRTKLAARIGSATPDAIAVAPNTHELVYRVLSAYPRDTTVVTTDGEFHSLRRQLDRLAEDGTRVIHVKVHGEVPFADRFVAALDRAHHEHTGTPGGPRVIAALSLVMFGTAELIPELPRILAAAQEREIPVLVDAYHAAHALELDLATWPGEVFVVGGGYKYAEHGEGACWLHVPASAERLRPVHTGWFADFGGLEHPTHTVGYGAQGSRFLGSTFDPTAFYRALRVMEWQDAEGLSVAVLRAHSVSQTQRLIERAGAIETLAVATPSEPDRRGGFVAFDHPLAIDLVKGLAAQGVRADARGRHLRFGPAPYTTVADLDRALDALSELL